MHRNILTIIITISEIIWNESVPRDFYINKAEDVSMLHVSSTGKQRPLRKYNNRKNMSEN
jgi:hypothetical protein